MATAASAPRRKLSAILMVEARRHWRPHLANSRCVPVRLLACAMVSLLAACSMPSVKEITAAPPVLVFEWPKDQKSGVQCIVEELNALGWRSVVQDLGTRTQVVWNGPSVFGIPRPVAVFDVIPASAAKPSRIEMRVADDPSEPDRIRQSWREKLASCR